MGILDRFYDMQWWVAIRPFDAHAGFNSLAKYRVLKNTWRYWCADPFVFDHGGKTYIFMEVADKFTQKGSIGYRVIDGGKASKIRICLNNGLHMSYPMIYAAGDDIFMIPECFESGKLTIYRAVQFPDKWEPCETVLENKMICDTNYLSINNQEYLLTMPLSGDVFCYNRLELYRREQGQWKSCPINPIILNPDGARNGGHFFYHQGCLIRPSQNCAISYGQELVFQKVTQLNPTCFEQTPIKRITVADLQLNRRGFDGIHTYNHSPSYEVIDLRRLHSFQPARFIYFLRLKLRRKK